MVQGLSQQLLAPERKALKVFCPAHRPNQPGANVVSLARSRMHYMPGRASRMEVLWDAREGQRHASSPRLRKPLQMSSSFSSHGKHFYLRLGKVTCLPLGKHFYLAGGKTRYRLQVASRLDPQSSWFPAGSLLPSHGDMPHERNMHPCSQALPSIAEGKCHLLLRAVISLVSWAGMHL